MRQFPSLLKGFSVLMLIGACTLAHAQASRTWVSGVGDDANPCSRTAPCKTFAGAISKTAAGGTIDVLDPAGFGGVTITKSITIEADGSIGSVGVSGTNGVTINAATTDVVTLRGLKIVGLSPGTPALKGINVINVGSLVVEDVQIENFTTAGIDLSSLTSVATVNVRDTVIRSCGSAAPSTGGILIRPATGGSANVTLERVQAFSNTKSGLTIDGLLGPSSVNMRNSVVSTTAAGDGIIVTGGPFATQLMLDDVLVSENAQAGILATGSGALVRMSNSTVSGNLQGIQTTTGGQVVSFGNNRIRGNVTDGAPTGNAPLQ